MASAPTNLSANVTYFVGTDIRVGVTWTNFGPYDHLYIFRGLTTGLMSLLATLNKVATSYLDTSVQDGTRYYYKVAAAWGDDSGYSNIDSVITPLPKPTGLDGSATDETADLSWNDNSQNETGFKIYQDGVLVETMGQNAESKLIEGLAPGTWYNFTVKAYNGLTTSAASNTLSILTADPPSKPSNLVATATGTATGTLNWTDNADNEIDQKVERSSTSATAGFAEIATVAANIITYADTGRAPNTQYWYRVRARNASGYSAYSNVATMVTWAAIAQPTNLTVEAFSDTQADIRFVDNSELEDFHCLERRLGAGEYSEIVQLAPNRTFYRNSGLTTDLTYTYRVRAKQGASTYSAYSNEATVITLAVLVAPADLAVSEYQDTWARLTWTKVAGATGYRIAQSTPDEASYAIIATVDGDVEYFKVTGLTAGIKYYWKVLSYNGTGNGSYSASVNQTTRAAYLPSRFERLIRKSKPNLHFHIEANPLMPLSGWTLTTAQTYTYELPFGERGAKIDTMYENGVALFEVYEIGKVEDIPGAWWHDLVNGKVYIHVLDGTDPVNFTIACSFWLYFTSWKTAADPAVFNGHDYLPLVATDGIPDITQEIQQYYGDNFIITSGAVSLINGWLNKQFHFDKIFAKYIWLNRKMKILAGGSGFSYNELVAINTGIINTNPISDQRMTFDLRDYRGGLHRMLPTEKFSINEFPRLDENAAGQPRQVWFGTVTNIIPTCVDTTNRVFEFHNGRFKSVTQLKQNGTVLAENADYFVDYGLGQFTLARAFAWTTSDILLIDFIAMTNTADEAISNGADIFKYGMNEWLNVPSTDLDLDSIYQTKYACTQALALGIWKETGSQEFIRKIEQSIMAYSIQDASGRLGLRSQQSVAVSGIKYIPSIKVLDFGIEQNQDSLFSEVNFWYNENPSEDRFSLLTKTINTVPWLYGVSKTLDIYVAISALADVETLAALVLADLNKQKISFSVPRTLYTNFPGDLIYFNRDRFPSLSGVASNLLVRILSISKQYSTGRTQITAEVI